MHEGEKKERLGAMPHLSCIPLPWAEIAANDSRYELRLPR